MPEPTGTLTFSDLIIRVAKKLGIAYYGASGSEAAQVPIDAHDLDLCKTVVNDAIRMFIHDGPKPNGWRWLRPVAEVVLWPSVSTNSSNPILTAVHSAGSTTITATSAAFYPSMELKSITITDVGTFTITSYTSATVIVVSGNASAAHAANKTFSITADGNYTLPLTFGGQYIGGITYAAGTNRGSFISWGTEAQIREGRSNVTDYTGTPLVAAVRVMNTGSPRRRWELMVHPKPSELLTVQFPYLLYFDELVSLTEVHPAPFGHDESIKAACLAIAEKDVEDTIGGPDWQYYREVCLSNSYTADALSAPKKLGYNGNVRVDRLPTPTEFRYGVPRPTVIFNP